MSSGEVPGLRPNWRGLAILAIMYCVCFTCVSAINDVNHAMFGSDVEAKRHLYVNSAITIPLSWLG